MRYEAIGETDIGISKHTNQDSLLIKHAITQKGEIMMAIICDGMGGLAKGELASAEVIRAFSNWFDLELPKELAVFDLKVIARKWELMLKDLNMKILAYGKQRNITLGTTFTGILFIDKDYMIVHVGDTRVYELGHDIKQLTEDHTVIAKELKQGRITEEQAKYHRSRNILLQCIGASKVVVPQIIFKETKAPLYLLCSDGFRHKINEDEIVQALQPIKNMDKNAMTMQIKSLIHQVKVRGEKDNISAILIKTDRGGFL